MRIVVLYGWLCLVIAGCSSLSKGLSATEEPKEKMQPEVSAPRIHQPIGFTQELRNRDPYTGALPYVVCFGRDCDKPTPKTYVKTQRLTRSEPPVVQTPETKPQTVNVRLKESIGFLFNSIEVEPGSEETLHKIIRDSVGSKEIWIKGLAGLTDTNLEHEKAVMSLALSRARFIERRMKVGGVAADISVGAELVRCPSETECLKDFKYGGRRADLEILITKGNKNGE